MWSLFRKDVNVFFSSLIGYLAMGVFFIFLGLQLWVFGGNILESNYATLDQFFLMTPWVLLFLIPAITMRSFADEFRSGTIELLVTRPLTDWQIVGGKFLASIALWLFTFLPTLLYFWCISVLDLDGAAIDAGATIGSYIGLFLLGCVFVAIGIFASSLSSNQIVAFLLGVLLCYLLYDAFARISELGALAGTARYIVQQLGIGAHYDGLSRGLVDSRDLVYFASVVGIFLLLTRTALSRRKW
jgi:ABC-2 type transport system permease protein